ncbi:rRNA maturation RNase YbeY [Methylobacillus flagellatus]|uniref:rRNA maturation RNase YbeY n=1 Tax=Methylobacillus flagellatus TaxID=405 RepID=UPI002853BAA3|nr:rRNA maturation RNase YbeY [Methylobacillus flagellatus]MDR5170671.1 rRNA maturation RNase YbeY [Methylobacillus flagellatus]
MPKLAMSVQYASESDGLPSEKQFRRWARATLRVDTEATLRIVDEEEGRMLNRDYRGKDYATNVLTFPLVEEPWLVGDIILCAPVVAREAHEQNITLEAHYAHLTVHGILHMHGYDHEEEYQAELMESIESSTMIRLGYADPYLSEKRKP